MFTSKLRKFLDCKGRWGLEASFRKNFVGGRYTSPQLCRFTSIPRVQSETNAHPDATCKEVQEGKECPSSSIPLPGKLISKRKPNVLSKKRQNGWPGLTGEFADNFKKVMISREFDIAMELLGRMKAVGHKPKSTVLNGLLTLCHTKAHLSCALELFAELFAMDCIPNDSAYTALIRCYSDADQIDTALTLIDEMKALSMELKLRTYHPILEAASRLGDFKCSLSVIKQMIAVGVIPRSDHFTLLLEASASSGALNSTIGIHEIDALLRLDILDLLDMDISLLQRIVSALRGVSLQEVRDEGVMNSNEDTEIPGVGMEKSPRSLVKQPLRLVQIGNKTSSCPNCLGKLSPLFLDSAGRERVRVGLINIAHSRAPHHATSIQVFGEWLHTKSEFKYIIDGANVAYHHQNFNDGKFSYKQIELLVDKMLERGDGKVLVLLPAVYSRHSIPNKCCSKSGQKYRTNKRSTISEDDKRILRRLEENNMLYIVPSGANDDWYWIYATVNANRKSAAYVVTNDMIRDHRLAFLEPRPFIRWRSTQVMSFSFSKAAKSDSPDPETFINEAVEFSMEAQETVDGKWHIPAADGVTWLCMGDLTRPLSLSPSSSSSLSPSSSSSLSLQSSSVSTTTTAASVSDEDGHVGNDDDDRDVDVTVGRNKISHRMPSSQYSAPSFKRKYFNALNPVVFDDILHPSDLPTNYPGPESSTVNPTVSSTVSTPPLSKLKSASTSTSSHSHSESSIHSNRNIMESEEKIVHSPVDNVL